MGGSVVHREFFVTPSAAIEAPDAPPRYQKEWREAARIGSMNGDAGAKVQIVELSDLECPFCAKFHDALNTAMAKHPGIANVVYVPFPLSQHRFAIPAARAAECARDEGKFAFFVSVIYAQQDSLGLKSFGSLARDAGIADTTRIARCALDSKPVKRIDEGRAFGERINVQATPTIIINGWRFSHPPAPGELEAILDAAANGKALPFDTTGRK